MQSDRKIDELEGGNDIPVTNGEKPIENTVPTKAKSTVEERRAVIAKWLEMSNHITLGGLKIKDLIAGGRR